MASKADRVYLVTRPDTHSGGSFRARTAFGAGVKAMRHPIMKGAHVIEVVGFCHREASVRFTVHNGLLGVPGA